MPGITRTANALEGGVPTMGSWAPALAEVVRAGEAAGAAHLAYSRGAVGPALAASPGRLLVVPHEFERLVGWVSRRTPPGTEHTSFALRCSNRGAQFAWLDAGVHVPVAPGGFAALFARRAREHAALARLLTEESLSPRKETAGRKPTDEDDEYGSATLNPASQTLLATMCVSDAFAKLAPILCFAAPFVRRATGPEALALALGVGVVAAAQTFVYAVGFYVSSGARHLARGAPGYVLYLLLFAATLALVPLFSLFELSAIVASPLFAARRGAEARGKRAPPRGFSGGGADARSAGSASSSDSMIGSDGEARDGPSLPGTKAFPNRVEPKSSKSFRTSPSRPPRRRRRRRRRRLRRRSRRQRGSLPPETEPKTRGNRASDPRGKRLRCGPTRAAARTAG